MKQLNTGDKIRHDFSKTIGTVIDYRTNADGYNYRIDWDDMRLKSDWYTRAVLEIVTTPNIDIGLIDTLDSTPAQKKILDDNLLEEL